MRRIYPLALACLLFALTSWLYMTRVMWLGFPDGFIAELDAAEAVLVTWFNWFSLALGIWCLGLGFLASRIDIRKQFFCACILFVVAAAVTISIDQYFRTYMADSAGG